MKILSRYKIVKIQFSGLGFVSLGPFHGQY